MAYIGREPLSGEVVLINSIESQFNGVLTTFNLTRTVSGVTSAFYPISSEQLLVSLGGVIQEPDPTGDTGFRISFNQIIFAIAPAAGVSCFIISYGNILDIGTPSSGSVTTEKLVNGSVTPIKLSTGGPWWLTNGNVGIGTTNPTDKLHIQSTGVVYTAVESTTAVNTGLRLKNAQSDWYIINDSAGDIQFYNGSRHLNITSTGNVGIGTATPSSKFKVQTSTYPTAEFYSTYTTASKEYTTVVVGPLVANRSGTIGNVYDTVSPTNSFFHITPYGGSEGSSLSVNNTSGNVGIGTANPTAKLEVSNSSGTTGILISNNVAISLKDSTGAARRTALLSDSNNFYYGDVDNATSGGNLFLLSKGNINFFNNGTNNVTFSSNGNVGIGTASIAEKLHIHNPDNGLSAIRLSGSAVLQTPYNIRQGIVGVANSGFSIWDVTAAATRFAIDSAGNIGIGTDNSSAKLHVLGNQFLEGGNYFTTNTSGYFFAGNGSYAGGIFAGSLGNIVTIRSPQTTVFENNGVQTLNIDSTGYIVAGYRYRTSNLTQILEVAGRYTGANGDYAGLYFRNSNDAGGSSSSIRAGRFGDNYGTDLSFYTQIWGASPGDGQERLRITSAGNVGIGTTNPQRPLHVTGSGIGLGADADIRQGSGIEGGTSYGRLQLYNPATGTTTLENLGAFAVDIRNNGSSRIYIKSDGNVGIGTANPGYKLEVVGTVSASSGLRTLEQVRATGWYNVPTGSSYNGLAVEMGISSGTGYILCYNRDNGNWGTLNIQGSGGSTIIQFPNTGNTINVTGNISSNGNITLSGPIFRSVAGTSGYLNGNYNSVETPSTPGTIYTIGGAYVPTATTLGIMYGIGYGYSGGGGAIGNPGGVPSNTWGMYVASAGTARIFLDSDNGRGYFASDVVAGAGVIAGGAVYAAGTSGFYSSTFANNVRNPIWRFANADGYGLSYFQGSAGVSPAGGGDTIGFHFGTATAAASLLQLNNGHGAVVNGNFAATGNVGIGTTNPTKKLEVAGGEVSFSTNTAGKDTHLFTTNASNDGRYLIKSDTTTKVDIQANGSTYFNGGNVGIGTTNPSYKLHVTGTSSVIQRDLYIFGNTSANYGNRLIVGNTDTSFTLQDTNLRPTIQAHGAYPVLSLNHTITGNTSHGPTIQFTCNGTGNQFVIGTTGNGSRLDIGTASTGDWNPHNGIANHSGTTHMSFTTSGNVGVGTLTPTAKLVVDGGGPSSIAFRDDSIENHKSDSDSAALVLNYYGLNGGTSRFRDVSIYNGKTGFISIFDGSSGNVGIGTANPSQKLHVEGVIRAEHLEGKTDPTYKIVPDGYGSTGFGFLRGGGYITESATNNGYFQLGEKYIYGTDGITGGSINFQTNANSYFMNSGNVGIGITNPAYKLQVNGSFAATTKSFVIPHPTKEGYSLRYGSLEGPENGVYVRGRSNSATIELPEYWTGLVHEDSITVNLTPIGDSATPRVRKIENNQVEVFSREEGELDYYYMILAERKDVDRLEVELEG